MIKRYWAAQIKVLSEIDRVCHKHGIRWFADCGTLLGAVRHGGYIPWDDDLDICMMRHDWIKFFKVAKHELPEGYCVLSPRQEKDYKQLIGRIVNAHEISFDEKHMKEFFGCPYTVGVDIFPLDGLSQDEADEEKRITKIKEIQEAYSLVSLGQAQMPEFGKILADIERRDNVTLREKEDLLRWLRLLIEELYMQYPSEDAKDIALMHFWVSDHNHKYGKDLFENTIFLPFEYTTIPVPVKYNEVLKIEYGDYMTVHKGGGIHDYPVYKDQEEILRKMFGGNPYRYTMTADAVSEPRPKKTGLEKCRNITETLIRAHSQAKTGVYSKDTKKVGEILNGCQSLAISLGTYMENNMPESDNIVHMLEEYCESVYMAVTAWDENSALGLNESIKNAIGTYFSSKKNEILFLPCKIEWWVSMEKVYDKYLSMTDTDVYVMPLTYILGDRLTQVDAGSRNDRLLFPKDMNIVTEYEYNIASRCPDVIVIQYPYDEWGTTMDVSSFFHSKNLNAYTNELIYVPCFDVDDPLDKEDKTASAIKVMIEQPAVLYADKVVVSSAALKDLYIDTLSDLTGSRNYWENKIVILDDGGKRAPSKDTACADIPEEWKSVVGDRKILIFGVNGAFLAEHGKAAVEKLRSALGQIEEADRDIACVYCPGRDLDEMEKIYPKLWQDYAEFADTVRNNKRMIYDHGHCMEKYIDHAAAYYGTAGTMAHKCVNSKKPVMLMNIIS